MIWSGIVNQMKALATWLKSNKTRKCYVPLVGFEILLPHVAASLKDAEYLEHFGLVSLNLDHKTLRRCQKLLAGQNVFIVPDGYANDYAGIVEGLHRVVHERIEGAQMDIVNMSLQAPGHYPFNEQEPINIGTKVLFDYGVTTVIAAGNFGEDGNDTMSPWAVAPWVISVGAADSEGSLLADFSSRGVPGSNLYRPTVVAPGIDMIGAWPRGRTKTESQKERDAKLINADNYFTQYGRKIDEAQLDPSLYTTISGTSPATTYVTGLVARLIEMRKRLELTTEPEDIKDILEEMAVPLSGYASHEIGAGFLNHLTANRYFNE